MFVIVWMDKDIEHVVGAWGSCFALICSLSSVAYAILGIAYSPRHTIACK